MGFSQAQIDEAYPFEEEQEREKFAVLEENWPTLEVFLSCDGEWVTNDWSGCYVALRATGIESAMNMLRLPGRERPKALRDIRAMQNAARPILNRGK